MLVRESQDAALESKEDGAFTVYEFIQYRSVQSIEQLHLSRGEKVGKDSQKMISMHKLNESKNF